MKRVSQKSQVAIFPLVEGKWLVRKFCHYDSSGMGSRWPLGYMGVFNCSFSSVILWSSSSQTSWDICLVICPPCNDPSGEELGGRVSCWCSNHYFCVYVTNKLLGIHFVPSSKTLMKMLNRIRLSADSWGSLLIIDCQLCSHWSPLRAQPFREFSVHITAYSSSQYFQSLSTRISRETFSKTWLKSI